MDEIVEFKSIPKNWNKEKDGRKTNTIRQLHEGDKRKSLLDGMEYHKDFGVILMRNTHTEEAFAREISDVTLWEGWYIISWRHQ